MQRLQMHPGCQELPRTHADAYPALPPSPTCAVLNPVPLNPLAPVHLINRPHHCRPLCTCYPSSYRASEGISSPFKVLPVVKELGRTRLEATVAVRSLFGPKAFALSTVLLLPVPDYTSRVTLRVSAGKAKYDAAKKAIVSRACGTMPPMAMCRVHSGAVAFAHCQQHML